LWTLGKVSVNNQREIWEPRRVGEPKVWSSAFAEIQPTVVMAQKKDGTLWLADTAWGHKAPVQIDKKLNWQALMVGEAEILALGKDGRLWRIDGGDKQRIGLHSEWKEASTARHHSVAIRKDGTLWSWGQGEAGELGTIYSGAQPSPVRIGGDSDWWHAVAADHHTIALKSDGSLWAWGSNLSRELGVGTPLCRPIPRKLEIP
jgi:alpha-tubulin suppressor-like RCC1 family protein